MEKDVSHNCKNKINIYVFDISYNFIKYRRRIKDLPTSKKGTLVEEKIVFLKPLSILQINLGNELINTTSKG